MLVATSILPRESRSLLFTRRIGTRTTTCAQPVRCAPTVAIKNNTAFKCFRESLKAKEIYCWTKGGG